MEEHLPSGKVALSPCSGSQYTSPEAAKLTSSTKTSSTTVSVTITTTCPIYPTSPSMRHHQQLRQPSLNSPELGYAQSRVSANSSVDPACFHQAPEWTWNTNLRVAPLIFFVYQILIPMVYIK
ncbi:hypothetical protein MKX03_036849 [Papaver bracteatum]|nr:hypothetical protein MKX03_036849 [Papaver bracteatum]